MDTRIKISIVGSGKVATHLAESLFAKGYNIFEIYARNPDEGKKLAEKCNSKYVITPEKLSNKAELLIFSISDNALGAKLFEKFSSDFNVVHTSGSVSMSVLSRFKNYGVFYPLQSFSYTPTPDFKEIPICLESSNNDFLQKLNLIAESLSNKIYYLNSQQREKLHIAAVFASNFTNYIYSVSEEILKDSEIEREIVLPLINETAQRLKYSRADKLQTGPAVRGDDKIIKKHIELIDNKDYKELYNYLSNLIFKKYNEEL